MKHNKEKATSTLTRTAARIGVLVPYTNSNLEPDMMMLCPKGTSLHFTRMGGYELNEIPDENQMAKMGESDISTPLSLLAGVKPDIIIYGCTSATLTHGPVFDQTLAQNVLDQYGIPTITAAGSLVDSLNALDIKNIAFASPYVEKINDSAIQFLQNSGFNTVSTASVENHLDNYGQGELSPKAIYDLAVKANSKQAQAIVLSCTDMRALEVINILEEKLKKPVVTSNQALLYCALRNLKIDSRSIKFGRLFNSH